MPFWHLSRTWAGRDRRRPHTQLRTCWLYWIAGLLYPSAPSCHLDHYVLQMWMDPALAPTSRCFSLVDLRELLANDSTVLHSTLCMYVHRFLRHPLKGGNKSGSRRCFVLSGKWGGPCQFNSAVSSLWDRVGSVRVWMPLGRCS